MRYVALHFLKESQKPPAGWKGHRVIASYGYFSRPRWQVRRDAQSALRLKRELWRAEAAGYEGAEALTVAEAARLAAEAQGWELVQLSIDRDTGELLRVRPSRGGELVHAPRIHSGFSRAEQATRLLPGELARRLDPAEAERLLGANVHVRPLAVDALPGAPERLCDVLPARARFPGVDDREVGRCAPPLVQVGEGAQH